MAKKRIEIIASVEAYENLSSFKSINDLNEAVRAYKDQYKEDLNKTDLILLDILHRYSAKYTGVSFLTKNNLAKMLGCTRKTITRKCNKFEMLGIIKQYETKRSSDMKQTSNAIVILPIQGKIQSEKEQNVSQELNKMSHQKNKTFLKQIHYIKPINMNR